MNTPRNLNLLVPLLVAVAVYLGWRLFAPISSYEAPPGLPVVFASEVTPRVAGEPPTKAEVLFVIGNWFERGAESDRARAHELVESWDDGALPAVRAAALNNAWFTEHFTLLCVLNEIESPAALELLLDLLEKHPRSNLDSPMANTVRWAIQGASEDWKAALGESARFKQIVLAFATKAKPNERADIAECAAKLDWQAAVPTLESWLDAEDQEVRKEAASALQALTGREYAIERVPVHFPRKAPVEGMLQVRVSPITSSPSVAFQDARGEWALASFPALRHNRTLNLTAPGLDPSVIQFSGIYANELIAWKRGEGDWLLVMLGSAEQQLWSDRMIAIKPSGEVEWTYQGQHDIDAMRPFLTDQGAARLAIHEGQRLVVLGPDGSVQVDNLELLSTYRLLSHPAFPGQLYSTYFGRFDAFDFEDQEARKLTKEIDVDTYPVDAVLVPNADGEPVFVFCGSSDNSVPVIEACDRKGRTVWRATLEESTRQVHSIRSAKGRDVILAVERHGILSAFDVEGTLLARINVKPPNAPWSESDWTEFIERNQAGFPLSQSELEPSNQRLSESEFWAGETEVYQIAHDRYRMWIQSSEGHSLVDIDLSKLDSE